MKSLIRSEQGIGCMVLELLGKSTAVGAKTAAKGEKCATLPDLFPAGRESAGTAIDRGRLRAGRDAIYSMVAA